MPAFTYDIFDRLSAPGPRLDWLADWLRDSVWSPERFSAFQPVQYLQEGERTVNEIEEVIASSAPRTYDELTTVPANRDISQFLDGPAPSAVVVFDGLSLRSTRSGMLRCSRGRFNSIRRDLPPTSSTNTEDSP